MPSISNNSAFFIFLLATAIVLMLIVFLQPAENDDTGKYTFFRD
jgi:preprotein translocase subunit SecG